jgi:DNA-binding response OmpR family regulator
VLEGTLAADAPICVLVATAQLSWFNFIRVVLAILGVRRVEHVSKSERVVAETERIAPDLILLHDLPPAMDGFVVLNQLREHVSTTGVPVIAFDTGTGGEPRRRTLTSLSDVLLPQPCLAEDLRAAILFCLPRFAGGSSIPH